jgi:hypothetical protein
MADRDWDNAFTGTELRGKVEHSPAYGGALSFMRRKYTRNLTGVDVAVTGIPFDSATSNRPGDTDPRWRPLRDLPCTRGARTPSRPAVTGAF